MSALGHYRTNRPGLIPAFCPLWSKSGQTRTRLAAAIKTDQNYDFSPELLHRIGLLSFLHRMRQPNVGTVSFELLEQDMAKLMSKSELIQKIIAQHLNKIDLTWLF